MILRRETSLMSIQDDHTIPSNSCLSFPLNKCSRTKSGTCREFSSSFTSFANSPSSTKDILQSDINVNTSSFHHLNSKVEDLLARTEDLCNISSVTDTDGLDINDSTYSDIIKQWHQLLTSMPPTESYRYHKRRRNKTQFISRPTSASSFTSVSDDLNESLKRIQITCAENMDRILQFYIQEHKPRHNNKLLSLFNIARSNTVDANPTEPFQLVMNAWNQASHHAPQSGQKAAEILEIWGELYGGDMNHAPSIHEFNIVLDTYAKCSSADYDFFQNKDHGHGHGNDSSPNSFPAEMAWNLFSILARLDDPTMRPNIVSCSHLIRALCNHTYVTRYAKREFDTSMDCEIAAIRAYFAWKHMVELMRETRDMDDKENSGMVGVGAGTKEEERIFMWRAHSDILAMSSDAMLRRDDGVDKSQDDPLLNVGKDTEDLLVKMLQIEKSSNGRGKDILKRNEAVDEYIRQAYSSAMKSWTIEQQSRIRRTKGASENDNQYDRVKKAAISVVALLELMKVEGLRPQLEHYNSSIVANLNCLHRGIVAFDHDRSGKDVLPQVRKLFSDVEIDILDEILNNRWDGITIESNEKVPASIHQNIIKCYYRNMTLGYGRKNDIMQAAKVLENMFELYEKDLLWIERAQKPLVIGLNLVLDMFSRLHPTNHGIRKAEELIERLKSLPPRKGSEDSFLYVPKLDSRAYGTYLALLSRWNGTWRNQDSASKIAHVLDIMAKDQIKLRSQHYSAAIKGLVKGGNGQYYQQARKLVFEAIRDYNSKSVNEKEASDFNAAALYTTLISRGRSSEAISLLNALEKKYSETMDPKLRPDLQLYSAVLKAIAVDKKRAEWKDEKAIEIIESIEVKHMNGEDEMTPNKYCYTPVLEILSKSKIENATDLAQKILDRMDELYLETKNFDMKPDAIMFTSVMKIWSSRNSPSKANKTWDLHKEMLRRYNHGDVSTKPSLTSMQIVLDACACTSRHEEKEDALQIALKVRNEVFENPILYGPPNAQFYNVLLNTFGNILQNDSGKEKRTRYISDVFERCCKDGMLSNQFLKSLDYFHPEFYNKLRRSEKKARILLDDLPNEWSSNFLSERARKGSR